MICYHTTDAVGGDRRPRIPRRHRVIRFANLELTGVWLGDSPMDINEGATGDHVLRVEFPDDVDLGDFELVEEHKPYREWCVPAELINALASVTKMSDDDVDELARERWPDLPAWDSIKIIVD